jgi:hypothetical protein
VEALISRFGQAGRAVAEAHHVEGDLRQAPAGRARRPRSPPSARPGRSAAPPTPGSRCGHRRAAWPRSAVRAPAVRTPGRAERSRPVGRPGPAGTPRPACRTQRRADRPGCAHSGCAPRKEIVESLMFTYRA